MLFAIGFIFTFIHGGLTGLFLGNVTVDLPLSDTYFVVAHFHMVMGVAPLLRLELWPNGRDLPWRRALPTRT